MPVLARTSCTAITATTPSFAGTGNATMSGGFGAADKFVFTGLGKR